MRLRFRKCRAVASVLILSLLFCLQSPTVPVRADDAKYYIKVNKGTNVVTVYTASNDKPYVAFTCSAGYATPLGTFKTPAKYRWHLLEGPSYGQYCTRINGGVLFHSVWYYSQTNDSQAYAQYNKLGSLASHGCIRLTVAASKWIYDNCPIGTSVTIFSGDSDDDPLGKPKTIKVSGYSGWDPTDPAPGNPYASGSATPVITVSKKTLAYGSKFGDGYMTCKDSGGFDITDMVHRSGKVDTKKPGSYRVEYKVIDSFGRTASKSVTYKVVDNEAPKLSGVKAEITKKLGNTRDMLVGLKARDAAGRDLTKSIAVSVKAPSSDRYVTCKSTDYTFKEVGKYRVKYTVTNPHNGKKASGKQLIRVTESNKPLMYSKDGWADILLDGADEELYWDDLMKGVSAEKGDGSDITDFIVIEITAPSGEKARLVESESFTFSEPGDYEITYKAYGDGKNPKPAKQQRTLTVPDNPYESENPDGTEVPDESEDSVGTDAPEEPGVSGEVDFPGDVAGEVVIDE